MDKTVILLVLGAFLGYLLSDYNARKNNALRDEDLADSLKRAGSNLFNDLKEAVNPAELEEKINKAFKDATSTSNFCC